MGSIKNALGINQTKMGTINEFPIDKDFREVDWYDCFDHVWVSLNYNIFNLIENEQKLAQRSYKTSINKL